MKQETKTALLYTLSGAFFTFVFMFIIPELYKAISKSDFEIEYKTLQIKKASKAELIKINQENFDGAQIDFSMDDTIIPYYYYAVLEINNLGGFIEDDVITDLFFDGSEYKILDVMCKMQKPEERLIGAEIERPPLELNPSITNSDSDELNFNSNSIDQIQVGLIIYRSYSKDVGFGRINTLPLTDTNYSVKIPTQFKSDFTATHMGFSGEETDFASIFPYPEFKFNEYSFKNTKTLNLEKDDFIKTLENYKTEFTDGKAIFVNSTKKEFYKVIYPYSFTDLPIYFEDDVKFLKGKTSLLFHNIPKKAKYKIFVYYKTYVENRNHNISLQLREIGNIELKKKDKKIDRSESPSKKDSKTALTPQFTRIYLEQDKILMAWTVPQGESYRGVRIFKTVLSENDLTQHSLKWGNEVYDGEGFHGLILGRKGVLIFRPKTFKSTNNKQSFQPPIKEEYRKGMPSPPILLRLTCKDQFNQILNGNKGKLMPYFVDENIECNDIYKYTLVAYDEHHSYSYPIESIVQHPCSVEYAGEHQYSEIGVQPYVKSYQKYDDDLTLISILNEYYKQFDNKVGLSDLKQLSKKNKN
jgi:hypothetical protein